MLEIYKKRLGFNTKQIWFAEDPFDVRGVSRVIFRDLKSCSQKEGFVCEEFSTLTIDLRRDINEIWNNVSSVCRRKIGLAEKERVKAGKDYRFDEFYKLNKSFRIKKGLHGEPPRLNFIKKYGTLFLSEINGEIVSGQVYLEDEDNIRYWIGASKRLEVKDKSFASKIGSANRLLHWRAIEYAKEKGIKEFDFGGYYTGSVKDREKEGISFFKKGFGGKLVVRYACKKDYSKVFKFLSSLKQKLFL